MNILSPQFIDNINRGTIEIKKKGSTEEVAVSEIKAKSMLRKHKRMDSWFISRCGMNLYRGCAHNCVYCDGRSEGYYVEGDFGRDVSVKTNAAEILRRELDPKRKRVPFKPGFILLGGGVGDSYQPLEKKYCLSRKALELMVEFNHPVHVLTKSTLVTRDIDLLKEINRKSRAIVSFSFSSADDELSSLFEPHVPTPTERLKAITFLKTEGIACGLFLIPVIPFITDARALVDETIRKAKNAGVDFIIFGGMTLKEGRQKKYFYHELEKNYPDLLSEYNKIYRGNKWGQASGRYYTAVNRLISDIAGKHNVPKRMPPEFYSDILDDNDLAAVVLEHIDYLLNLKGEKSPFGYAAYSISQLKEPLSSKKEDLTGLKGVGRVTERIILEILETRRSTYLEKLLKDQPS